MMPTKTRSNSVDLFSCLLNQLSKSPVVLAVVTATQGSTTTHVGDKLLIWGDAQSFGDLGEDAVNTAVITQSFAVLKTGIAQRMVIDLDANKPADLNQVQVWLTRWQGDDAIATAKATLSALDTPAPSRLLIPLVTGKFPYIINQDSPSLRNLQGQDAYIEEL